MKTFIVETYSNSISLEDGLNNKNKQYFPLKIFYNNDCYTVVYCRKDCLFIKEWNYNK